MFPEINYLKQFLRKNVTKTKDFLLCVHKVEKDEDYM